MTFQRDITLVGPGDTKRSATVSYHARHWNEGSYSRRECSIRLRAEGRGRVSGRHHGRPANHRTAHRTLRSLSEFRVLPVPFVQTA
jgi:hypothetical protein